MSKLKFEADRLSETTLGLTLHAWRISLALYLIGGFKFRLHSKRQPGSSISRTCLYLLHHYVTVWR
jgi:hypothetical protein